MEEVGMEAVGMDLEQLGMRVTEEERDRIIEGMFGRTFDGTVDFADFDDSEIINAAKREVAKEEILAYAIRRIKEEFHLLDDGEALLRWDDYKLKHGLTE